MTWIRIWLKIKNVLCPDPDLFFRTISYTIFYSINRLYVLTVSLLLTPTGVRRTIIHTWIHPGKPIRNNFVRWNLNYKIYVYNKYSIWLISLKVLLNWEEESLNFIKKNIKNKTLVSLLDELPLPWLTLKTPFLFFFSFPTKILKSFHKSCRRSRLKGIDVLIRLLDKLKRQKRIEISK